MSKENTSQNSMWGKTAWDIAADGSGKVIKLTQEIAKMVGNGTAFTTDDGDLIHVSGGTSGAVQGIYDD